MLLDEQWRKVPLFLMGERLSGRVLDSSTSSSKNLDQNIKSHKIFPNNSLCSEGRGGC